MRRPDRTRLWRRADWTRLWRVAGWFGVVLTLVVSLTPPALDMGRAGADKLVHVFGYALLMFWWAQVITRRRWRLALAIVVFGGAIELLQGLTPDRLADPLDALVNALGVALGWVAARILPNPLRRLTKLDAPLPASRR